jgi:hypothetical protein
MAAHVVFLRAVNLGARRRCPKAELAAVTETAGFAGVATYRRPATPPRDLEARSSEGEQVVVRGRAVHPVIGEAYHLARVDNARVESAGRCDQPHARDRHDAGEAVVLGVTGSRVTPRTAGESKVARARPT